MTPTDQERLAAKQALLKARTLLWDRIKYYEGKRPHMATDLAVYHELRWISDKLFEMQEQA